MHLWYSLYWNYQVYRCNLPDKIHDWNYFKYLIFILNVFYSVKKSAGNNLFLVHFRVKYWWKIRKNLGSSPILTVNFFQPKLENSLKRFKIQFYIRLDQFLFSDHRIVPKKFRIRPLEFRIWAFKFRIRRPKFRING